jgi:hypothetical protein
MTISFSKVAAAHLAVYQAVARQMLAAHHEEDHLLGGRPLCGITMNFGDESVTLHYRVTDGTERLGPVNEANAYMKKSVSQLLAAIRSLRDAGINIAELADAR